MGILILLGVTAGLAGLDLFLKSTVEGAMTRKEERTALDGRVIIRKVYNRGMCMGIFKNEPETVKYTSAFVTVILTIYQLVTLLRKKRWVKKAGLSLVTAGAWSNTVDRWLRGYVIDYIGFRTKKEKLSRITYNIGDFCIAIGGVLTILAALTEKSKKE